MLFIELVNKSLTKTGGTQMTFANKVKNAGSALSRSASAVNRGFSLASGSASLAERGLSRGDLPATIGVALGTMEFVLAEGTLPPGPLSLIFAAAVALTAGFVPPSVHAAIVRGVHDRKENKKQKIPAA
jgi:hypothetical protein